LQLLLAVAKKQELFHIERCLLYHGPSAVTAGASMNVFTSVGHFV
jgi:hypothetical protein